jgi:hypothetical protein
MKFHLEERGPRVGSIRKCGPMWAPAPRAERGCGCQRSGDDQPMDLQVPLGIERFVSAYLSAVVR